MGKQFYNELDGKEQSEYSSVYDILKTIEQNGGALKKEDTFNYLIEKSKDGKLPEMPLIKYYSDIKVPVVVAKNLLSHISYMLKNDIKLPDGLIYYITQAFDAVIHNEIDLNRAFLFKTKLKKTPKNYEVVFKYIVGYISVRISILYTLGKNWDEIVTSKNNKGIGFYEELSQELYLNYDYENSNSNKRGLFDFTEKKIKDIVENEKLYNTIGFINPYFVPLDDCTYSKYIKKYRLYLEKRMRPGHNDFPLEKTDATQRIKELDLIDEYLRMQPEELPGNKKYISWVASIGA